MGWTRPLFMGAAALAVVVAIGLGFATGLAHFVAESFKLRVGPSTLVGATVDSLKARHSLIVFTYGGSATVKNSAGWSILSGTQMLSVPANVQYVLELSELQKGDVTYDPLSKTVRVELPPLKIGEVSLAPERAEALNAGLLTINNDVVADLQRRNFSAARAKILEQAQNSQLIRLAEREALASISHDFEVPLRAAGQSDIKVDARFRRSGPPLLSVDETAPQTKAP